MWIKAELDEPERSAESGDHDEYDYSAKYIYMNFFKKNLYGNCNNCHNH